MRYYRDPARHPKRKFIGIVFEKEQNLPQHPSSIRRRKLGMLAYPMSSTSTDENITNEPTDALTSLDPPSTPPTTLRQLPNSTRASIPTASGLHLTLRPGYQYRAANHEIGRAAELAEERAQMRNKRTRRGKVIGARLYPDFKPRDRFTAWRKAGVKRVRAALAGNRKGAKGGKKKTRN